MVCTRDSTLHVCMLGRAELARARKHAESSRGCKSAPPGMISGSLLAIPTPAAAWRFDAQTHLDTRGMAFLRERDFRHASSSEALDASNAAHSAHSRHAMECAE